MLMYSVGELVPQRGAWLGHKKRGPVGDKTLGPAATKGLESQSQGKASSVGFILLMGVGGSVTVTLEQQPSF